LNGDLDFAPLEQLEKAEDKFGSAIERSHVSQRLWIVEDVG